MPVSMHQDEASWLLQQFGFSKSDLQRAELVLARIAGVSVSDSSFMLRPLAG